MILTSVTKVALFCKMWMMSSSGLPLPSMRHLRTRNSRQARWSLVIACLTRDARLRYGAFRFPALSMLLGWREGYCGRVLDSGHAKPSFWPAIFAKVYLMTKRCRLVSFGSVNKLSSLSSKSVLRSRCTSYLENLISIGSIDLSYVEKQVKF